MIKHATSDYRNIFLENKPLIDVRSPGEFLKGTFPTSCNIPLLNDEERAAVGLCYKRHGQDAAIALGHKLVTGTLREERLAAWVSLAKHHPAGCLYCFRGGLRSSIVQKWLNNEGISYPLVNGGYKAMRRFLIEALEESLSDIDLVLVSGRTGVGKTRVIDKLDRGIDLEKLAKHRGSTFGKLLEKQPSQISFENELSISILKACAQSKAPIFIEDEGKLIGRINLPNELRLSMEKAPIVFVRASLSDRIHTVLQDYVLDLGEKYSHFYGVSGKSQHRDRLIEDLSRIRRRLGGQKHDMLSKMIHDAFEIHWSKGCHSGHREWIGELLRTYYDPMYDYQLSQRKGRVLMKGTQLEVIAWAKDYKSCDHR